MSESATEYNHSSERRNGDRSADCYARHAKEEARVIALELGHKAFIDRFINVEKALERYDGQWRDLTLRFESMNARTAQRDLELAKTLTTMDLHLAELKNGMADHMTEVKESKRARPSGLSTVKDYLSITISVSMLGGIIWAFLNFHHMTVKP